MAGEFSKIEDMRKLADKMMKDLLCDSVEAQVVKHGSIRKAAKAMKIDEAYLRRLRDGSKVNPSPATLRKLGIDLGKRK